MTTLSPTFRISPLAQLNVAMAPDRRVSAATDGAHPFEENRRADESGRA
jgi:hypothetical protein